MNAPATPASLIDRQLLLAILATQANLVTPQALLTGLHTWIANPEQPLVAILLEQRALAGEARSQLDGLMARYLQTHGDLPAESAEAGRRATLRWFIQLCRALDFAESRSPLPVPKPADRGPSDSGPQALWERRPVERTESTSWPGALNHPERVQGRAVFLCPEAPDGAATAAAHVYGMGVVLYSLLTGQRPFADTDATAVLERVRQGDFWPPRAVQPRVSPALEAICLKAMAREPANRYASPRALADELDRWLADEPLAAYAPPLLKRWRRWGKRHRALATTATLMVAMAALAAGVILLDQARHVFAHEDAQAGRFDQSRFTGGVSPGGDAGRWLRTRDVLGALTTRILDDWLEEDTPLSPQQRNFLEVAFAFYNLFSQDAGTDPLSEAGQADAVFYMGLLQERLDHKGEAERNYRRSEQLLEHAVEVLPGDQLLQQELAECHLHLGGLQQARGELTAAEREYKQGLMRFMAFIRGNTGPEARMVIAEADYRMARVMMAQGHREDAAMALRQAQGFLRPFIRSGATDGPRYQTALVRAYKELGKLYAAEGHDDDANDQFDRALTLQERIVREHPDGATYQNDLANLLGELAQNAYQHKDYPAAQARLDEALPHHQAALATNPRSTRYRRCFRDNLATRADVLLALGRHRDAATTAQNMLRFTVDPGSDLYRAACLLSRCASTAQKDHQLSEHRRQQAAQAYSDRAMGALRRAVAAGFQDRDSLTHERALEPLRTRKDFQQLLAKVPTTKAAH